MGEGRLFYGKGVAPDNACGPIAPTGTSGSLAQLDSI